MEAAEQLLNFCIEPKVAVISRGQITLVAGPTKGSDDRHRSKKRPTTARLSSKAMSEGSSVLPFQCPRSWFPGWG